MSSTSTGIQRGVVSEFDEPRGLGIVSAESGESYVFHCTALTDGTRRVSPGSEVVFATSPGHLGHVEAREIVVVSAVS